jgi:Ni,Fe-hydrogenase maturation factor
MKREKRLFRIYVFGNSLVKEDSIPIKILPKLKSLFRNISFIELDPTENFPKEKNLLVIDTVINTDRVRILENIDNIIFEKKFSVHDFDLGFQLKLMKKMGENFKVRIIGIPPGITEKKAAKEVENIIDEQIVKMIL